MSWSIILKPLLAILLVALTAAGAALFLNRTPLLTEPGIGVRTWTYLSQNRAETARISAFPELRTRYYHAKPTAVFKAALAAAEARDWELLEVDQEALTFAAVATTPLLRFQDDVAVSVATAEDGRSELRMRSQSRVGRGDFGANARRIVEFHQSLEQRL